MINKCACVIAFECEFCVCHSILIKLECGRVIVSMVRGKFTCICLPLQRTFKMMN